MRLLLLFALCFLVFPSVAIAQDGPFFNVPEEQAPLDEILGLTPPKEKREKTGNIKKDIALRYYDNCSKYDHPLLTEEGQDILCSCTSDGIENALTTEEAQSLYKTGLAAIKAREKMMKYIYGPCMQYPIRNLAYDACMGNKAVQDSMDDYKVICNCSADTMGRFMSANYEEIMNGALQSPQWYNDPLGHYLQSDGFQLKSSGFLKRCVQIHVYGWK